MSACLDVAFVPPPRIAGFGKEAKEIQRLEAVVDEEMLSAIRSGEKLRASLAALKEVFTECSVSDWDGYGARPANPSSIIYAYNFLRHLPPEIPEPEIGVDPDGEIALEWHRTPRCVFSVSVGPLGELTYAGLFGRNKKYGVETPVADEIPREVLAGIRRVT